MDGAFVVPATLLFTLVVYQRRIENTNYTCSICYMEIDMHDRVGDLECNHVFCIDCIQKWADVTPTCPICRGDVNMIWVMFA
jgi:hypothetical protein